MASAFVLDLALLLYVELTRDAIAEFMHREDDWMLVIHVSFSVAFVLLYLTQMGIGLAMWKQDRVFPVHAKIAILFIICRLGGFITSFFVSSP